MRVTGIVAQWLFILCMPVLLVTASVSLAVNALWFYQYGFEKYGVSQTTGLSQLELDRAAAGLIEYFNSNDESISLSVTKDGETFELFNNREVGHLWDVKGLFQLVYRVLLGTMVYALVYVGMSIFWWHDRRRLSWGLIGGSCLSLVLMLALGLGIFFNFDWLFLQFHFISFANDLWMLDPSRDYLIMLFPSGFWFDAAIFCTLIVIMGAVIMGGVGWWYVRKRHTL